MILCLIFVGCLSTSWPVHADASVSVGQEKVMPETSQAEKPPSEDTPAKETQVEEAQAEKAQTEEAVSKEAKAEDPMAGWEVFQKKLNEIHMGARLNLLQQVTAFEELMGLYGDDEQKRQIVQTFLAWKLSSAGRVHEALEVYEEDYGDREVDEEKLSEMRASLDGFEAQDALTVLVRAAAERRVVIVNEGHHMPQHRVLTTRLLPHLRRLGFTHFAAETLAEGMDELKKRGYPAKPTGTYTDDPVYADMVRTALDLGFKIVAYEAPGRPNKREPGQAKNLKERVFDVDPEARLVVHVGYSHNMETQEGFGGVGAMAFHLQEMTGLDPLTVEQTELAEKSRPGLEHGLFAELCGDSDGQAAVVFGNAEGDLWSLPGILRDVSVCLPRTRMKDGRPAWLGLPPDRRAVAMSDELCGKHRPCLVEARFSDEVPVSGEGDEGVPLDTVLIRENEKLPALMLRPGSYRIVAEDEKGTQLGAVDLEVAASANP